MASLSRRSEAQSSKRAAVEASVLAATEALLAEGASYADLAIEPIATRAGISRTAFYFYFRDKRDLLMRLTAEVAGQLYSVAERWWSGEGDGAAELADALAEIAALYSEHRDVLRAVVEAAGYDEETAVFWRAIVGRFIDSTRERIAREQAGELASPDLPAAELAFSLCWMTERACYQRLVAGAEVTAPEFVRSLTTIWRGAIYGGV